MAAHDCPQYILQLAQKNRQPEIAGGLDDEALAVEDVSADAETVRRAVAELPVEFREMIVLREMEGLSYKEIAVLSAVPIGTVMSRLARARKRLQQRVAGEPRGQRDFLENNSVIQCAVHEADNNRKVLI